LKKLLIVFLLFLLLSMSVDATSFTQKEKLWLKNNLNIGLVAPRYIEPYVLSNFDGTFSGIVPDYLEKISEIIGSRVYIKVLVDAGKGHSLSHEEGFYGHATLVDSLMIRKMHSLTNSYMKTPLNIFTSHKSKIKIQTHKDLEGKKVAVLKGHLGMMDFLNELEGISIVVSKTPKEQLILLQNGEVDAVVGYVNYHYFINKLFLTNIKLAFSLKNELSIHMGVNDKNKTLKSILNKAIGLISKDELYEIQSKWFREYIVNDTKGAIQSRSLNLTKEEKEYLANKPYLSVMSLTKFHPFSFKRDAIMVGYTNDILQLYGSILNKEIKLVTKTWNEQLDMLKKGTLDFIPYIVSTDERKKYMDYVDFEHINYLIGFATNKNNKINSMADLKGKKVAVVNKYFVHDHLKNNFPNIELVLTDSTQKSLEAVAKNEVYAALDNVTTLNYFIKEGWLRQIAIKYVDDLGLPHINKLHMSVKKGNHLLKSILEKVNKVLPSNKVNSLKEKWFGSNSLDTLLTQKEKEYLDEKPYISVMSLKNFQPFSFKNKGEFLGYSVEIMRLIGKSLNKDIKFIAKPWNEQLEMLKNGQLDVIPHLAVTDERKKFVDYTNFIHITFLIGFAIQKDQTINSMEDLKGKTLAVVKGYYLQSHIEKAFPHIKLLVMKSTEAAVDAVAQGKAYAVIDNTPTLNYFIQEKWLSNLKIATVEDLGLSLQTEMPMGLTKGNYLLKSILQKANKLIPFNEHLKLKRKWLLSEDSLINLTDEEKAYLKDKKIIKMCVLPDWLPFEQIDEYGAHKGIGADIMKIVSKSIDTPIELMPTKVWAQSLQSIRDRKCDILPVAMDIPSRRDAMNFTKPYVKEPFVIATKSEQLFIKNVHELSNRKVGIVKSYAHIEVLKSKNPSIEILEVVNTKEGLEKVSNGELFGYIDTMPTIGYGIQKYSLLDLKIAGKLEFDIRLSVASRNDEPLLNSIMQKALDTISEERKRTIVGKWIEIKVAQEFDYTLFWQVGFIFLVILLAIIYKNRAVSILNKKLLIAKQETQEQQNMIDKFVLIFTTDLSGVITNINDAYSKSIGYTKDELLGQTHAIMRHPDMKKDIFRDMWNGLISNDVWSGEVKNFSKEKTAVYFFINIEPIVKETKKIGYRSICENITDKKRIEELSVTDQLTQLANRLKLEEIFKTEIQRAKRYKHPFSVILLDIDNFKSVNDTYGHDIGDETLKSVAKVLKESVRSTDIVGRWGGEEFIILASETNLECTVQLAEKIRNNLELYQFKVIGSKTSSFGVSTFEENDTQQTLVKKADNALYKAKNNGRNRVEVYTTLEVIPT
jgi:diguanylate cyclase (GGDEF)-like protein/PAS domain S-box-containing protein